MNITSIDNVSGGDDGLQNLIATIGSLDSDGPGGPRQTLVVIVPEYERDDDPKDLGRLLRLDVLSYAPGDETALPFEEIELMDAVFTIVKKLQARRAAALAKLDAEPPITVVNVPDTKEK